MTLDLFRKELKASENGSYHITDFALRIMAPSEWDQARTVMENLVEENPNFVFTWTEEPTGGYTISWRRDS